MQWTGIPVSVGIAATKTLAKVANHRAKKDPACQGVCVMLDDAAIDAELARLPLTEIWGIAGRLSRRLEDLGITTPLQLKQTDPRFIRERFSVTLERTGRELRGIPCIALEHAPADRKSVMASRSFGKPVTVRHELEEAVASYATRAAEKMRRQNLAVGRLMVFVQTNVFRPQDAQYSREQMVRLPVATADTGKIVRAARLGLNAIWRDGFRYKKAGVMLLDLVPAGRVQGGLFDAPDTPQSQARMRALDTSTAASAAIPSPTPRPASHAHGRCSAAAFHRGSAHAGPNCSTSETGRPGRTLTMCGRFTQHYTWEEVHDFLSVFGPPQNLQPHYNIAPTDTVDVIRLGERAASWCRCAGALFPAGGRRRRRKCPPHSTRAPNPSPRNRCSATPSSAAASSRPAGFTNGRARRGPNSRISSPRPTARRCSLSPVFGIAGSIPPASKSCPARSSSPAPAPGWRPITTACRYCWRKRFRCLA